jgi:Family of unknown function (DUF6111)
MARIFAFDAVFFLIPFAVYALWLMITRGSLNNIADWQARTIAWLAAGGAVLMVAVIVIFVHLGAGPTNGTYVPAHVDENGNIVPGHFE